jgi:hypothetical protein
VTLEEKRDKVIAPGDPAITIEERVSDAALAEARAARKSTPVSIEPWVEPAPKAEAHFTTTAPC